MSSVLGDNRDHLPWLVAEARKLAETCEAQVAELRLSELLMLITSGGDLLAEAAEERLLRSGHRN